MERQTLQQEAPVYHVCQQCGGEGCEACSDFCILDGDIELDPYECRYCGWIGGHVDGCVFVDPDLDSSPINGVIGIIPSFQCPRCGKTDFDSPEGCQSSSVYSPAVGDWLCCMPGLSGAVSVSINCRIGGEK